MELSTLLARASAALRLATPRSTPPVRGRLATTTLAALTVLLAGTLAAPGLASAADNEWTVGGGIVGASIPTEQNGVVGVGAMLHVRYGIGDSFSLAAGALYSHHFPSPSTDDQDEDGNRPIDLLIPRLGVRYALDVLDLVPYLLLDATVYLANEAFFGEEGTNVGVGLMAGLGLEYRRWRDMSLGLELGYHAFLTDISDYPVYISLSFHVNWHSDPF